MHSRTKKIIYVWLSLNYIKRTLDPNLLFTDTGSLTYEFKRDVSGDFYIDNDLYDLSNKKKIQGFWSCQWKSIGKMKDESNGKIITDFVRWKLKSY